MTPSDIKAEPTANVGPLLLDTCAAIWLMAGDPLTDVSQTAIYESNVSGSGIYVSPFTAWEVGMLNAKGRYYLAVQPSVWFDHLLTLPSIRLAPLSPTILLLSNALPGQTPNDPADRIIAATARLQRYTLITRDRPLLDYAEQGHIKAIAC